MGARVGGVTHASLLQWHTNVILGKSAHTGQTIAFPNNCALAVDEFANPNCFRHGTGIVWFGSYIVIGHNRCPCKRVKLYVHCVQERRFRPDCCSIMELFFCIKRKQMGSVQMVDRITMPVRSPDSGGCRRGHTPPAAHSGGRGCHECADHGLGRRFAPIPRKIALLGCDPTGVAEISTGALHL